MADCNKVDNRQVLLDHRKIILPNDCSATYEVAVSSIEKLATKKTFKVALIVRPERMEFARIYEAIGHNRGLDLKAFEQVHMAMAWLSAWSLPYSCKTILEKNGGLRQLVLGADDEFDSAFMNRFGLCPEKATRSQIYVPAHCRSRVRERVQSAIHH